MTVCDEWESIHIFSRKLPTVKDGIRQTLEDNIFKKIIIKIGLYIVYLIHVGRNKIRWQILVKD